MGELVFMVRDDWYGFDCVGCGEEVQLPDMWVKNLIRNNHSFKCKCGQEMSIPPGCADLVEG